MLTLLTSQAFSSVAHKNENSLRIPQPGYYFELPNQYILLSLNEPKGDKIDHSIQSRIT